MLGIQKGLRTAYYADELTHLNIFQLEERVDITGKYIFTFVRDPYTKMVSEFHWRMRNISARVYNEPTRQKMGFGEYMETLLERWDNLVKPHNEKAHVLPQHTFIDDRVEVFRYEQFEESCERLKEILGLRSAIPHENKGARRAQHTKRTIEIVNELYEEDFKRFNYAML